MYSILLSASSLSEELIISNNFALFQMVIIVGAVNTVHYISYGRTWIKLSTAGRFFKKHGSIHTETWAHAMS